MGASSARDIADSAWVANSPRRQCPSANSWRGCRRLPGPGDSAPRHDMAGHAAAVNGRNGERPRRSTGELYDAIWAAELPPIMDERDTRAPAVSPAVARMVLLAMASFTNPNRDQHLGTAKTWQCFAAVATIAERADVSERQVQRVLRVLEYDGYIELTVQARRPGRPRKDQAAGRGRPNTWCLRPERWPLRVLKNRTGVVAISADHPAPVRRTDADKCGEIPPVPVEVATTPESFPRNSTGTGGEGAEKPTGVVTRTRSTSELLKDENPINKPAVAAAPTHGIEDEILSNAGRDHQVALPLTGAMALTTARAADGLQPSEQPRGERRVEPPPPPPKTRCVQCGARQDEQALAKCANRIWHEPNFAELLAVAAAATDGVPAAQTEQTSPMPPVDRTEAVDEEPTAPGKRRRQARVA